MATKANSSGHRVVRISSLLPVTPVRKPISGRNRANAIRPVKAASRSAPAASTRSLCAPAAMSNLLDIRPAEQALRQEDQGDRQHGKSRDILIVDRKIGRPERLDQADQEAADHCTGQRADAAEHCGGKCLYARYETVGETDDAIIHEVHGAG